MQDIRKEIGQIIRKKRKINSLTQAELAANVGVDPKYISRIETGISYPSLSVLEKIFETLGIKINSICEYDTVLDKKTILENINKNLKHFSEQELNIVAIFINALIKNK